MDVNEDLKTIKRELEELTHAIPKNIRKEILAEAERCVCTDRNEQYGSPEDNFQLIADYWNIYLGLGEGITAHDVGIMMVFLKLARLQTGKPKEDSYIDACGYLACSAEIALKNKGELE